MRAIAVSNSERMWLQSRISSICNNLSTKSITLSAQAHSGKVCSILISVSGIFGTIQNTVVMVKSSKSGEFLSDYESDDPMASVWYGFANGVKYEFSGVSELASLIKRQTVLMKQRVTGA